MRRAMLHCEHQVFPLTSVSLCEGNGTSLPFGRGAIFPLHLYSPLICFQMLHH